MVKKDGEYLNKSHATSLTNTITIKRGLTPLCWQRSLPCSGTVLLRSPAAGSGRGPQGSAQQEAKHWQGRTGAQTRRTRSSQYFDASVIFSVVLSHTHSLNSDHEIRYPAFTTMPNTQKIKTPHFHSRFHIYYLPCHACLWHSAFLKKRADGTKPDDVLESALPALPPCPRCRPARADHHGRVRALGAPAPPSLATATSTRSGETRGSAFPRKNSHFTSTTNYGFPSFLIIKKKSQIADKCFP